MECHVLKEKKGKGLQKALEQFCMDLRGALLFLFIGGTLKTNLSIVKEGVQNCL